MTDLRKILRHIVIDAESGQTIAGFAVRTEALRYARDKEQVSKREYRVRQA